NYLAVFAKREAGRSLLLIDVLHGGVAKIIDVKTQQPFAPSWSPDGRSVAFAGNSGGHFDVFVLDVASGEVKNLTNDERFDGGPGVHLAAFWKGGVGNFPADPGPPAPGPGAIPGPPTRAAAAEPALQQFQPDIQVTINPENHERYSGRKMFLEDGDVGVGVS